MASIEQSDIRHISQELEQLYYSKQGDYDAFALCEVDERLVPTNRFFQCIYVGAGNRLSAETISKIRKDALEAGVTEDRFRVMKMDGSAIDTRYRLLKSVLAQLSPHVRTQTSLKDRVAVDVPVNDTYL